MTTIENRQRWGNFLLILAWILVVIEVLISSMIGWSFSYQTYEIYTAEFGSISFNYFDLILAGLPFLMVAAVCLTVIPICYRIYTRDIKVKIIFLVVLLAITAMTFETLVAGFERQFNNSSKSVVIPQGKLDLVLEEIQFNEELIENIEKEFADVESEEQQNLEKMIKENNAAIEVYRKNIRDREKLIEAEKLDPSLTVFLGGSVSKWEKEIKEFENKISRLLGWGEKLMQILIFPIIVELERLNIELERLNTEKLSLQQEFKEAYEGIQIYRLAQSVYDLEEDEYISKAQIATVAKFWFGSLGGIIVLIPILLAFSAFRLKYGISGKAEKEAIIKEVVVEK